MDDHELVNILETEKSYSSTSDGSEFQQWRDDAMDYYKLTPRGDHKDGQSDAESPDIQSMVDQTISQIMPRYQRQLLAEYMPFGPDDAENAQAETVGINSMVLHNGSGYEAIRSGLFDSLLCGLSACVVYWDTSEMTTLVEVDSPDIPIMAQPGQEIERFSLKGKHYARIIRPRGELIIKPIPLKQLRLSGDADCLNPDNHRYIGYETFVSTADLLNMGVDQETIDEMENAEGKDTLDDVDDDSDDKDLTTADESNKNKLVTECWYKVDFNEDGRVERRHVRYSGNVVLTNEEVSDEVDLVLGTGMHQPHKPYGWSFYLKEKTVQDVKREVLRQAIDSGRLAIDNRWIAEKGAIDLATMQHSRAGGIVFAQPGRIGGIQPIQAPDGMGAAMPLMTYMDKIRSEVGGNALDMAGEHAPVTGSTAHGVERIISSREQMAAEISETFSRTFVKRLFLVVHRVLRRNGVPVRITINGATMVVPANEFPERTEISVNMGPTQSQRAMRQQALTMMLERMVSPEAAQLGLVTPDRVHAALVDLGEAYQLPDAEKYWLDPNSDEAKARQAEAQNEPPPPEVMQQMELQRMQLEQQQNQMEIVQAQLQLEYAKAAQQARNDADNLDYKYAELEEKMELQAQELDLKEDAQELDEQELYLKYANE